MSKRSRRHNPLRGEAGKAFDFQALKRICEMPEMEFAAAYGMETEIITSESKPFNFYHFLNRGASILAVAHLDTVANRNKREATIVETQDGPCVFSRALDDRLGAYTILELLPKLGIDVDVLLTTGEEIGQSTAQHFYTEKDYNWIIEFDRGGMDVVHYQYENAEMRELVRECGAKNGWGSYSDIAYMEHLQLKAFNWGTGYEDYHYPRAHVFILDYLTMVEHFQLFYAYNSGTQLEHAYGDRESWGNDYKSGKRTGGSRYGGSSVGYSHGGGYSYSEFGNGTNYGAEFNDGRVTADEYPSMQAALGAGEYDETTGKTIHDLDIDTIIPPDQLGADDIDEGTIELPD